jgi:hypothetical protein
MTPELSIVSPEQENPKNEILRAQSFITVIFFHLDFMRERIKSAPHAALHGTIGPGITPDLFQHWIC